ncbi:MAG: hypothetical protein H0V62_07585, partial [Gammaproteobacteria bacterium]|nr:hypothetical protein [Gammaproteobacteria bacterium]
RDVGRPVPYPEGQVIDTAASQYFEMPLQQRFPVEGEQAFRCVTNHQSVSACPTFRANGPAALHAHLIKRLNAGGIRAIVFDVNFTKARDPAF